MDMNKVWLGSGVAVAVVIGLVFMTFNALPGNPLYGIKLGTIEPIKASFAGEGRELAEWHIKVAGERLNEAARSASKGNLDSDAQEAVLLNFNEHMKDVESYIAELQVEEKFAEIKEIAILIGQTLAAQAEVLNNAQAKIRSNGDPEIQGSLDFLLLRVGSTMVAAANIAASTLLEDEAPDTSNIPTTDEWGNPL
jgi:hypothetical protein